MATPNQCIAEQMDEQCDDNNKLTASLLAGEQGLDKEPALAESSGESPADWVVPEFRWYHWLICVSLDMLGPFSTDSYIPNLPEMVDDLHTTAFMVRSSNLVPQTRTLSTPCNSIVPPQAGLTIQMNWIVKGFANVWLGRLSDFYGRKPVVLCSFVVYIAATAGCAFSPNIYILLLARIVQAIGEANAVISSAIARDVLDDPSERMRMMAILGTIRWGEGGNPTTPPPQSARNYCRAECGWPLGKLLRVEERIHHVELVG